MQEQSGSTEPTDDQILVALGETGFLLEQRVARELEQHSFNVTLGYSFQDPDEDKSRDIDVFALRNFLRDKSIQTTVDLRLIVECKNTTAPFLAIGRAPNRQETGRAPEEHVFRFRTVQVPVDDRYHLIPTWHWLELNRLPGSPSLDTFRGNQLVRLDRRSGKWNASNSSIFDSLIYPLAKALRATQPERSNQPHWMGTMDHAFADLTFPLVVTAGPIFQVDTTDVMNPSVKKVSWTTVTRHLETNSVRGIFNIDITSFDRLGHYLRNRVAPFASSLTEIVTNYPDALKTSTAEGVTFSETRRLNESNL
jgi:hypothetical protein